MELKIGDIIFYEDGFFKYKGLIVALVVTNERYYKSATVKWINKPSPYWDTFVGGWTGQLVLKDTQKMGIQRVKTNKE